MNPVLRPTVLIFDLDGTTHDIFETDADGKSTRSPDLSASAEDVTSRINEEKGICVWFVGKENPEKRQVTYKMRAIAREEFKKTLDRAYDLHIKYGTKSPLSVKIITRGDYHEHEILNCWDNFYDSDDQRFSRKNFPIEFFNRLSFRKDGEPIPQNNSDSEFDKGILMDENYPRWQKEQPGLTKERVFIVDDDDDNDRSVQKNGFPPAIKFPTTIRTRKPGDTFTEFGPLAFKKIHRIIDEAAGLNS